MNFKVLSSITLICFAFLVLFGFTALNHDMHSNCPLRPLVDNGCDASLISMFLRHKTGLSLLSLVILISIVFAVFNLGFLRHKLLLSNVLLNKQRYRYCRIFSQSSIALDFLRWLAHLFNKSDSLIYIVS